MINKADLRDVLIIEEIEIPILIKYKRKLHLSFRFLNETLIVSAPIKASLIEIKTALMKKKTWILKHQKLSESRRLNENELRLHDYRFKLIFRSGSSFSYELTEDTVIIIHPSRMNESKALVRFKEEYSNKIVSEIFKLACVEMNLRPNSFTLKALKSSHGRCNSKGQITLSINLIDFSTAYIRYVCIHELAHLKEMNHSKAFYALVMKYCPEYKKLVAQVRSAVL